MLMGMAILILYEIFISYLILVLRKKDASVINRNKARLKLDSNRLFSCRCPIKDDDGNCIHPAELQMLVGMAILIVYEIFISYLIVVLKKKMRR